MRDIVPAWVTAVVAILALAASSYFSYAANREARKAAEATLEQLQLERAPVLTITCDPDKTSPWEVGIDVLRASMPQRTFERWQLTFGRPQTFPTFSGNHVLCVIRNYGRAPAVHLDFRYTVSFCGQRQEDRSSDIRIVGAGSETGILLYNGDEAPVDLEVKDATSFVTPPETNRQPCQYAGLNTSVNFDFYLEAAPMPRSMISKMPLRGRFVRKCQTRTPGERSLKPSDEERFAKRRQAH